MSKTYTCPMHAEIVSDRPGKCPKCFMALVASDVTRGSSHSYDDTDLAPLTWRNYIPLLVILLMISSTALIVSGNRGFALEDFLLAFMTGFFLVFGGFKLMDLKGFAHGYATYDLLASRWYGYGYVYPFVEVTFGLLMLGGFHPDWLLWSELGLMVFSGMGVGIKLARKEKFRCACLGTLLKVPLTSVTLVEDFGMALLLLFVIFSR